jgi:endonuclease IV
MIKKIRELVRHHQAHIVIHSNYISQMAHPINTNQRTLSVLGRELKSAMALGAEGVVVHCGSKNTNRGTLKKRDALANIVENYLHTVNRFASKLLTHWRTFVEKMKYPTTAPFPSLYNTLQKNNVKVPKLLLEFSAGGGGEVGKKVKDFDKIFQMLNDNVKTPPTKDPDHKRIVGSMIGVCIDTCHVFASGVDLRRKDITTKFLQDMDKITSGRISLFHFNDSGYGLGQHKDVHDTIGCGYIGSVSNGGKLDGFMEICHFAEEKRIPVVLETAERECVILNSRNIDEKKSDNSDEQKELVFVSTLFTGKPGKITHCKY